MTWDYALSHILESVTQTSFGVSPCWTIDGIHYQGALASLFRLAVWHYNDSYENTILNQWSTSM